MVKKEVMNDFSNFSKIETWIASLASG